MNGIDASSLIGNCEPDHERDARRVEVVGHAPARCRQRALRRAVARRSVTTLGRWRSPPTDEASASARLTARHDPVAE